ncbi:AraC family transcriptional regulator [Streptomyces sp. WAC 06738]|uniref:helix-turn-helix domain-containing protein n=1 Tax=Streptomyces sp. WAC 06738 TaxID=2203210 RepID=UPI001F0C4CDE|nr:AraC family transcriptional regulator [Streptomyces sp. WAC 06738]
MRHTMPLARDDGFTLEEQRMHSATDRWWPVQAHARHALVLGRRGSYAVRLRGWQATLDPVSAFAAAPGDEQTIAHRAGARDMCTVLTLDPPLLDDLTAGGAALPDRPVVVDGRTQLRHRLLLRHTRRGADRFTVFEEAIRLATAVLRQPAPRPAGAQRPATARAQRRIVRDARDLLAADPAGLSPAELARAVGVSPHHLSRIFHRHHGRTLSQFRLQVRIHRALDRIEAGESDLSGLAADLGFADHAHLTRTLRTHVGHPPTALRRLLGADGPERPPA